MNFTPVKDIDSRKMDSLRKVDVVGTLTDILSSPYDTVMLSKDVVSNYSSIRTCRTTFAMTIKRKNLNSKLRVCMRNDKIYICKIKEG